MIFINFMIFCISMFMCRNIVGETPKFRVLAPPFVCPKDKDAVIDKPDHTVVTLQTEAGSRLKFHWTLRWTPLVAPTQRFTLALWRTVRDLEVKLNRPPVVPNIFIINNTELLRGVDYIFNITATSQEDEEATEVFKIENIKGDPKLMIDGQSDMFSVAIVGGQLTYSDLKFIVEAEITTCSRTQNYYFVWSVMSVKEEVDVSGIKGSRLEIPANTLTPGLSYDVLCQVFKYSTGEFITQSSLPFRVQHRDLRVNFNIDALVLTVNKPFSLQTDISQLAYLEDGLTLAWECTFDGDPVDTFVTDSEGTIYFPAGLPKVGQYLVSVTVGVLDQPTITQANARVFAVEPQLPVLEVYLTPRLLNEGSAITLYANVSEMTPGCSITWYFREQNSSLNSSADSDNLNETEHGTPISVPVNFYSLEENFLSELTDYTNETAWKSVLADLEAAAGRARVVAECTCTRDLNCSTEGVVYADVTFQINHKPAAADVLVKVMPETGTAMETLFRLSTLATVDPNRPLRYSFYCELHTNDTLMLGSYLEHLSVETLLPFIDGGTSVWVEVCDSLGACSSGTPTIVQVSEGEARTVETLLDDARAHVLRCEVLLLRRLTASTVVTYTNAGQTDALATFTSALLVALGGIDERCIDNNYEQYDEFMQWLANAGIDTTNLE